MLEVGLNGLLLDRPYSGTAVYTRNLVPLLPQVAPDLSFRLFVRRPSAVPPVPRSEVLTTPLTRLGFTSGPVAQIEKLAWEQISLPAASALRRQALLHSLYFAAPTVAASPLIITIHDLIPLVLPAYHRSRQSSLYSAVMARLVTRAGAIITVSEHSKRDIVSVLRVPDSRVHVVLEAADSRFRPDASPNEGETLRDRYRLPSRFILYIGGAERRKGIETLVRAWARCAPAMQEEDVRLVIVATFPRPDPLYPDIPGLVRELGLGDDVILVPAVDENDKPALYRAALALAFPSIYEGFGLTPLEAMASGLPVMASGVTSIPEVVGDAGVLMPPGDVDAWSSAMVALVDSEERRNQLAAAGVKRAGLFSWRTAAEHTVRVYRDVLGA